MKQISMIITLSIEMPLEIRELKTAVFFFFLTVCYIHICHSLLLTLTSVIFVYYCPEHCFSSDHHCSRQPCLLGEAAHSAIREATRHAHQ